MIDYSSLVGFQPSSQTYLQRYYIILKCQRKSCSYSYRVDSPLQFFQESGGVLAVHLRVVELEGDG